MIVPTREAVNTIRRILGAKPPANLPRALLGRDLSGWSVHRHGAGWSYEEESRRPAPQRSSFFPEG